MKVLDALFMFRGIGLCSNIYVFWTPGKKVVMIDTGNGASENSISEMFKKYSIPLRRIEYIFLTHSHEDHISGVKEVLLYSNPIIVAHENTFSHLERLIGKLDTSRLVRAVDGQVIKTEYGSFRIIYTPGHTLDSICILNEDLKALFTGDTVFTGGFYGRTDLPTGDLTQMRKSLSRLLSIKVKYMFPGHGPYLKGEDSIRKNISEALSAASMEESENEYPVII
ncbi:hypothetical protein DRO02_04580 [archaeon]|nr:MAG: hypothetical protein DRO02_04580 [archaeon]RLG64462.1 MAG: hypothetical protein DRN89_02660 [archaeon]RLG65934.1 MAG: hypothetical protein DRO21_00650 [archaeon]HDM24056.1 MBL fold metallo-hydrolase [Candidatus Bathyarchaeota archaeon]